MSKEKKTAASSPNLLPQMPGGTKMRDLRSGGPRPVGFLVTPKEDDPRPTTFLGVLVAYREKPNMYDPSKKTGWGVFEAVGDQSSEVLDGESGELLPVKNGMLVGVSKKGGLSGMNAELEGHLFAIAWTGKKIKLEGAKHKGKNAMWEIQSQVSEEVFTR